MSIKVGNADITGVYVGDTPAEKVMARDTKVYPDEIKLAHKVPTDCLMFVGDEGDFVLTVKASHGNDGLFYKSYDGVTWNSYIMHGTDKWRSKNGLLYIKGLGNTVITTTTNSTQFMFYLSNKAGCYGAINTLLDPEADASTGVNYAALFAGCTYLTHAPDLPATTLVKACYFAMFQDCYYLKSLPKLPATNLQQGCYMSMFYGCYNCRLSNVQTDEYSIPYRIPSEGTGSAAPAAVTMMFTKTGGTFTDDPTINTTYYLAPNIDKSDKHTLYYPDLEYISITLNGTQISKNATIVPVDVIDITYSCDSGFASEIDTISRYFKVNDEDCGNITTAQYTHGNIVITEGRYYATLGSFTATIEIV